MYNSLLLPDLRVMIDEQDETGMESFCEALHAAVIAEVLEGLEVNNVWRVLHCCDEERQAEIIGFLPLPFQIELASSVDQERLSKLIEAMAPDDRVDLLERLDDHQVEDMLPLITQAERSDIRKLLSFPEDSAGSIMTTEYASLSEEATVRESLDRLRQQAPDRETIYYVYVVDEGRRLRGFISLRDLILAKPDNSVGDIMERDVISVRVDDDQEIVAQTLAKYDFIAIPVVDNQNQLVGIVTHDDALDVVQEEATEDAHRLAAVEPLEDSYLETPLLTLAWKRGIWLVLLLVAAFLTAYVLQQYEDVSAQYRWMVLFIPLVLASGGNAGSQSATLVIRTLAIEQMSGRESVLIAKREFLLALMLGGGMMLLSTLWAVCFDNITPARAMVVGLTVFLVVIFGAFIGAMLPMAFRKLGMDPALMSNPLVAALVDVLGVIVYYNVALTLI